MPGADDEALVQIINHQSEVIRLKTHLNREETPLIPTPLIHPCRILIASAQALPLGRLDGIGARMDVGKQDEA